MHDAASANDNRLLDDLFAAVAPAIEEIVTRALHDGKPLADLAVLVERRFDGKVRVSSCPRRSIVDHFGSDLRLSRDVRRTIVDTVSGARPVEVPAVLLVHAEGYVAAGVRKLSGELVAVS
jgi:hypothetical protein